MNVSDIAIFKGTNSEATGSSFLVSLGFNVFPIHYRNNFLRFISKIFSLVRLYLPFMTKLFFAFDFRQLTNVSTIIIFDSSIYYHFCRYIQDNFLDKKLILYFWNRIDKKKEREISYFRKSWEIFSFSLGDCRKYQLKYNKLFIPIHNDFMNQTSDIRQDVFFIGMNKGRINQLIEIKHGFDELGISYKLVCPDADKHLYPDIQTMFMSYEEVIVEDMGSKAILDINNDNGVGMTMRELEALFLKKKLITNNMIVKKRDYFHPDNVFIIDHTKTPILDGLKEFLEKPFFPIDDEIIKTYSIDSWVNRFFSDN